MQRGREVMANLPEDKECLGIIGRPYNTGDPALNLSMVEKLINLDVLPIPMNFLPLTEEKITKDYVRMYWPNGQRILSAARIIAKNDKLHAVFMGNFRCGPDSFLSHFVHEEMAGKPFMEIEIDEHSADAGMITRYEAFLDSLKGSRVAKKPPKEVLVPRKTAAAPMKDRTLYFPYMNDASYVIAATCRSFGINSESLPMQNQEDIELARKYTSSRECFPMICTTGSFLKKLMEPGVDPTKVSFFMPDHNGPCRFGQYNKFQRVLFDRLGFTEAEIISPSNDNSYEDISGGHGTKFRYNSWKGFVAVDLLRKFKQEHTPYELIPGSTDRVYQRGLDDIIRCMENDGKNLAETLENTIRYLRDSKWKGDYKGILKSKIQEFTQNMSARRITKAVYEMYDNRLDVTVNEMLDSCGPYIHRHYDGDPAVNLGTSVALAKRGVSGLANIIPFTCMPGTVVEAVSDRFKTDYKHIPIVHIAYDGQEDTSIDLRLQAFMHQAYQYRDQHRLTGFSDSMQNQMDNQKEAVE